MDLNISEKARICIIVPCQVSRPKKSRLQNIVAQLLPTCASLNPPRQYEPLVQKAAGLASLDQPSTDDRPNLHFYFSFQPFFSGTLRARQLPGGYVATLQHQQQEEGRDYGETQYSLPCAATTDLGKYINQRMLPVSTCKHL